MSDFVYRLALLLYPPDFRRRFGPEMLQAFHDRGSMQISDLLQSAAKERLSSFMENKTKWRIGYAVATLAILLGGSATVVRAYVISADSMAGTLRTGDHVL